MIDRIPRRLGFARFSGSRASRDQGLSVRMVIDDAAGGVRVAFSTPKRIGTAVVRNRVRRQLRELMRERAQHLPHGWYLLGIDHLAVDNSWGQLGISLDRVLAAGLSRAEHRGSHTAVTTSESM